MGTKAGYCEDTSSGVSVWSRAGNCVQAPVRARLAPRAARVRACFMGSGLHHLGHVAQVYCW